MQDDLVWEDWEGADYAAHGLTPPDRFYTNAEKRGMVGGTQVFETSGELRVTSGRIGL